MSTLHLLQTSPVLQPSTNHLAAGGELSRSVTVSTEPTAPRQTPLAKALEARNYELAYFDMRELARTKAHLMSRELYERVCRVRDYCGFRYNELTCGASAFAPPDWRAR